MSVQFGTNVSVAKKRVKFYNRESSAITIYEGMPVCYIFDTTANVLGYDKGAGGDPKCQTTPDTTAESYQNEGKFLIVETVNDDNHLWFAGVTTSAKNGKSVAATSYEWIEIYEPNGAIVPVRCDVYTTAGITILALEHDSQALTQPLNTSEGRPVAIAEETNTLSSGSEGLVLARLCPNEFIYQDSNGTALSAVGSDGGTSDVWVNRIKYTTAQTSGSFCAFSIQSISTAGAGSNGYGASLYVQGDLTGVAASHWNPFGCWANITGGTQTGVHLTVAEFGIYSSGANLDAISSLSCITLRNQVSSTTPPNGTHNIIRVVQDGGGDSADFLFSFYTPETVGLVAKTSAAVSHIIPINVENAGGGTAGTYYIMVSDAA